MTENIGQKSQFFEDKSKEPFNKTIWEKISLK